MAERISFAVKDYTVMPSPYPTDSSLSKVRFFVQTSAVPAELTHWMSTNPREQNLGSEVAQAIAASLRSDTHDFHLKNRGILLAAKSIDFAPSSEGSSDGVATLVFENENLHGNIDGGHTLRLILAAQQEGSPLPEQYVEFEVMTGLENIISVAEARNTSVALDMRSMEELKGSFEVLKKIFGDVEIEGDRFFDRVELKMNQQQEEDNRIDIRTLISIILMFNGELFGIGKEAIGDKSVAQMYGKPEAALHKYLELGGGDSAKRDASIEKMTPILVDIIKLWDAIEREVAANKKYAALPFAKRLKNPKTLFSNAPLPVTVPKSVMYPIISAFRTVVSVDEDGNYSWSISPWKVFDRVKGTLLSLLMDTMKTTRNNPNQMVKAPFQWTYFAGGMYNEVLKIEHENLESQLDKK